MNRVQDRKDILLQIIVAAEGDPVSPVQLQKVAFLVAQECQDYVPTDYYEFVPYDYGPFCSEIYQDVEELERLGYVSIAPNLQGTRKEYRATLRSRGADLSCIPAALSDYINVAVEWAMGLSFRDLVSAIYQHYPSFRVNSIFGG